MDTIVNLLSNVAFPIAITGVLLYYILVIQQKASADENARNEKFVEAINEMRIAFNDNAKLIQSMKESIEVNTKVIERLNK